MSGNGIPPILPGGGPILPRSNSPADRARRENQMREFCRALHADPIEEQQPTPTQVPQSLGPIFSRITGNQEYLLATRADTCLEEKRGDLDRIANSALFKDVDKDLARLLSKTLMGIKINPDDQDSFNAAMLSLNLIGFDISGHGPSLGAFTTLLDRIKGTDTVISPPVYSAPIPEEELGPVLSASFIKLLKEPSREIIKINILNRFLRSQSKYLDLTGVDLFGHNLDGINLTDEQLMKALPYSRTGVLDPGLKRIADEEGFTVRDIVIRYPELVLELNQRKKEGRSRGPNR